MCTPSRRKAWRKEIRLRLSKRSSWMARGLPRLRIPRCASPSTRNRHSERLRGLTYCGVGHDGVRYPYEVVTEDVGASQCGGRRQYRSSAFPEPCQQWTQPWVRRNVVCSVSGNGSQAPQEGEHICRNPCSLRPQLRSPAVAWVIERVEGTPMVRCVGISASWPKGCGGRAGDGRPGHPERTASVFDERGANGRLISDCHRIGQ